MNANPRSLGAAVLPALSLVACAGPVEQAAPRVTSLPPHVTRMPDPSVPEGSERPSDAAEFSGESPRPIDRDPSTEELRRDAALVLDDWHAAAAEADRDRYLGHFTADAVFLGTDPKERWDLATFTAYVDEYFPQGGWTYEASQRHVVVGPHGRVAWFDEVLTNDKYGALRGTGALRRDGGSWRIAHYSMTFTIPNDLSKAVTDAVKAYDAEGPGR